MLIIMSNQFLIKIRNSPITNKKTYPKKTEATPNKKALTDDLIKNLGFIHTNSNETKKAATHQAR